MTFVGFAFSDLSDIVISGTFIVGSSCVVQVLKAVARNMPCSNSSTFSCASSGQSAALGAMLKFRFAILTMSRLFARTGLSLFTTFGTRFLFLISKSFVHQVSWMIIRTLRLGTLAFPDELETDALVLFRLAPLCKMNLDRLRGQLV